MSARPVTVAVPVLDEEAAIGDCLDRLRAQTYADLEIVVVDGGSRDSTPDVVATHAAEDDRVVLLANPGRVQSAGLNEALAVGRGSTFVRVDARAFVEPDYVARVLDVLDATGAAGVGGRMAPRPRPGVVAAGIALANRSAWGAGPARFHGARDAGPVETVYLGAYRRRWLDEVGGWDAGLRINEDYELNHRIGAAGGVLWYDPGLVVAYEPRSDLRSLARQYFAYGRSKPTVVRRHPGSLRPRQVVPMVLVPAGAAAAALGGTAGRVARSAVLGHALLVAGASAMTSEPAAVRATAAIAALVMHWSWAAGAWYGVVRPFPPGPAA